MCWPQLIVYKHEDNKTKLNTTKNAFKSITPIETVLDSWLLLLLILHISNNYWEERICKNEKTNSTTHKIICMIIILNDTKQKKTYKWHETWDIYFRIQQTSVCADKFILFWSSY